MKAKPNGDIGSNSSYDSFESEGNTKKYRAK